MKNLLSALAVGAALLAHAPTQAQSPAPLPADPGPIVAQTSVPGLPVGWETATLFNLLPTITTPASFVVGANGDLFFTETVGANCGLASATMIFRVPMNGDTPVLPVTVTPFSTVPIDAHELVYDSNTNALYACGTCDQTGSVYRIPSSGVPELLNPAVPLNDPDGLTIGILPTKPGPQLLVTTQDGLFVFDLVSGPVPLMTQVAVDLSLTPAVSLGNWGFPLFDDNTATMLATNVGRPATRTTVELTFTSNVSAVATVAGPDNVHPLAIDHRGVRWFRQTNEIGIVNPGDLFVPVIVSGDPASRLQHYGAGSFFFTEVSTGSVLRIDRPLTAGALTVSASAGGIVPLHIALPAPRGNEAFLIVVSASGAGSGTPWGSSICPVTPDIITEVGLLLATTGDWTAGNWNGWLSASGTAYAEFRFWPGMFPSNVTFNLACIVGNPEYSSNGTWVHVLP